MIDRVTQYAERVAVGEEPAGKLHRLACIRHLKDLERQGKEEFPYLWKPEKANRIIEFAETLTIAEGQSPRPVRLYGFQDFDIGAPMGWYKEDGRRRFRRKYKSVARQNGKTFENGITGAYIAGFSGYRYGKLFTAATKKRQARIAWEEIAKFIQIDHDLGQLFRVQDYKSLITALDTGCTIEALSKEAGLDDGFRSIFCSIDELHQHRDNSVYKALYNGTRALKETLVSMITTRGRNLNSFCHEMDEYCVGILQGASTAEDFFVDIYCPDPEDDPFHEENFIKANPFLARTETGMETLRNDAKTAKEMGGSEQADFLTKAMNLWVQATDDQYIDPEAWKNCGSERTLEDMRGMECYVGLDLSSGGDLTTISLEFPLGEDRYFIHSHSFLPRGRLEEHIKTDIAPYDIWEAQGLITVTGGSGDFKNDYKFIIRYLWQLVEQYDLKIKNIGYDPHNADGILEELEGFGCPVTCIVQSARFLSDATEDLRLCVKCGTLEYHRGNELLTWSFYNAKTVKNSFGEVKVDKEKNARHKRIDPVDAVIDSHVLAMKQEGGVDLNETMDNYLKLMGWD